MMDWHDFNAIITNNRKKTVQTIEKIKVVIFLIIFLTNNDYTFCINRETLFVARIS